MELPVVKALVEESDYGVPLTKDRWSTVQNTLEDAVTAHVKKDKDCQDAIEAAKEEAFESAKERWFEKAKEEWGKRREELNAERKRERKEGLEGDSVDDEVDEDDDDDDLSTEAAEEEIGLHPDH